MKTSVNLLILFTFIIQGYFVNNVAVAQEINNTIQSDQSPLFKYNDLETWKPPDEFSRDFPYYLSGYDKEGRPVVIFELSRWNFTKYFEKPVPGVEELVKKYIEQFWFRLTKASQVYNTSNGFFLIDDMENFSIRQLAIPGVLGNFLRASAFMASIFDPTESAGVVLNLNFAGRTMFDIIRPFLGDAMGAVEFYGNNKERYIPRLLNDIPRDQLAEWYGGSKNFKPVKVFG